MPTEYELLTTDLHHHVRGGLEVRVPAAAWIERYGADAALVCSSWDRFRDPRETTYAKYTLLQRESEVFVDGILRSIDETGYDARLSEGYRRTMERVIPPARFLFHGLQMIAAYIGQMAPAGRVTIACAFQAADEMRRVQRAAYRMRQMQDTHPGFGEDSKRIWQSDPAWQPLREAVERLLVTFDWSEAVVALDLCLKPMIDELLMVHFAATATEEGDPLLAEILRALDRDCQWHRAWSLALLRVAVEDRPENRRAIALMVDRWRPVVRRAVKALAPLCGEDPARIAADLADVAAARAEALGAGARFSIAVSPSPGIAAEEEKAMS